MSHRHQPTRPDRSTGQPEPSTGHPTPDGQLRPALTRLAYAISALADPKPHQLDTGRITWLPPLYTQLRDSLPGRQGDGGRTGVPLVGCWLDALDQIAEIDTTVAAWTVGHVFDTCERPTIERLHSLEHRGWRPQDVHGMDQISAVCEQWVASIRALLNPQPRWTLPSPCPACGARTVYRIDSGGDRVRQPALQIGPDGCQCGRCRTVWAPNRFVFLARLIGSLPEGILE